MSNSTRGAYQLPDLLSLTRPFELRTNKHCRAVTDASEAWFSHDLPRVVLEDDERDRIPSAKFGLLATLCYPTCDFPQLRIATDLVTAIFLSNARAKVGRDVWDKVPSTDVGELTSSSDLLSMMLDHTLMKQ